MFVLVSCCGQHVSRVRRHSRLFFFPARVSQLFYWRPSRLCLCLLHRRLSSAVAYPHKRWDALQRRRAAIPWTSSSFSFSVDISLCARASLFLCVWFQTDPQCTCFSSFCLAVQPIRLSFGRHLHLICLCACACASVYLFHDLIVACRVLQSLSCFLFVCVCVCVPLCLHLIDSPSFSFVSDSRRPPNRHPRLSHSCELSVRT